MQIFFFPFLFFFFFISFLPPLGGGGGCSPSRSNKSSSEIGTDPSENVCSVALPIINAKLGKQVKREEANSFLSPDCCAYIISVSQHKQKKKISKRTADANDQPF
ncbi:hypothetical protein CEXT_55411 [Caerostris extrusa]|uniref:Secreted protein n=1 Tax=Caerostris extrusa TaxID=172846 RepID=A0AAV4VSE0_CAEEX|nr:hypothetical protein CEXT_55411 [Caerostris extrusa]